MTTDSNARKVRVSLSLDEGAYECLAIHALMLRVDRGELVGRLIREHLREYEVLEETPGIAR